MNGKVKVLVKSMTGYGLGVARAEGKEFTVELKAVNHRFSEVIVRMPKQFSILEDSVRKLVLQKVSRGRVDVYITFEETGEKKKQVKVDRDLAIAYYNGLKELGDTLGLTNEVKLDLVSRYPEVLIIEDEKDDLEKVWVVLEKAVSDAVDGLVTLREREGNKLAVDLVQRLDLIQDIVAEIEKRAPMVVDEYRERLFERLKKILPSDNPLDEGRLLTEVALYAEKSSITEEIVRLHSHLEQVRNDLKGTEPIGRKIDFILQEMNREINTIGSKSSDISISKNVVTVKSELEKIREQVQNIE